MAGQERYIKATNEYSLQEHNRLIKEMKACTQELKEITQEYQNLTLAQYQFKEEFTERDLQQQNYLD